MGKPRFALCLSCLLLLIPLLIHARRVLPTDTQRLVEQKYAGWSGVLRLWVFEGWSGGSESIASWLNRRIERFERAHPGVYVQPQYVDAEALAGFNDSGMLPPDMVLFPPGALDSPDGLIPVEPLPGVRLALAGCGRWNGKTFAVPVAMGGYMWAWNPALLDRIPGDWRDGSAVLAAPEPEPWRHWGAALLALCAGRRAAPAPESPDSSTLPPAGLDLGLPIGDSPASTEAPAPESARLPCRLPEDFRFSEKALSDFINGEVAALPVTQREIRRLQRLSDQGRGPDWRLSPGDAVFSDQLLCLGIVDRAAAQERQDLCARFLEGLLEGESQGELCRASAFSVTDVPSGYAAGDALAEMDAALRVDGLISPGCFGSSWRETANLIVRDFIDGGGESPALWRALKDASLQNPNIP